MSHTAADPRYPEFDPDAPNQSQNVFGLPHKPEDAALHLLPVGYEATTSYGQGTRRGPAAIRDASAQLDLVDRRYGEIWRGGIALLESPDLPTPDMIQTNGVDACGEEVCEITAGFVNRCLESEIIPGVIGGEHAISLGGILAAAGQGPIGVLQIDAHFDLRRAYEGFEHSHASVMWNALERSSNITRLVSVGIRDYCRAELAYVEAQPDRVRVHYDADIADDLSRGEAWTTRVRRIISDLPERVWISLDIDGLDPALCPNTGTPVPGGLSFQNSAILLHELARSDRTVVGFDIVEVAPGQDSEWDANVGARMLYQLCGCSLSNAGKI